MDKREVRRESGPSVRLFAASESSKNGSCSDYEWPHSVDFLTRLCGRITHASVGE